MSVPVDKCARTIPCRNSTNFGKIRQFIRPKTLLSINGHFMIMSLQFYQCQLKVCELGTRTVGIEIHVIGNKCWTSVRACGSGSGSVLWQLDPPL